MRHKAVKILSFLIISTLTVSGIMYCNLAPVRAERPAASEVEDSTLLIGTHLIYMLSMTPQIYDIAKSSAETTGQNRIYYKSELDPGVWYDITDAQTIYDFSSTQGKAVPDSVINGLELTHHTKPDGKTYDLTTGKAVSPVSIVNPYDIYHLPELEGMRTMYESYEDMESMDQTTRLKMSMLKAVLFADVRDSVTEEFDRRAEGLETYLQHLRALEKPDAQIIIASELQTSVDNGRRENVYRKVYGLLQEQALKAGQTASGQENVLSDILELLNSAQTAVESTRAKYEAGMLAEADTLEGQFRYETSLIVIDGAVSESYSSADGALESLEDLENIDLKQISHKERERKLAERLKNSFYASYLQRMEAGESEDYIAARREGNPQSVLSQIRDQEAGEYTACRMELQAMAEAVLLRTEEGNKTAYLKECMNQAMNLKAAVKKDDFAELAASDAEQLQEFMRGMMARVYKEQSQSSELQKLQDQLKKLQDSYQEALTANDLDTAVALENQISSLSRKIEEKNSQLTAEVNQLQQQADSLESQISAASDPQVREALMQQKSAVEAAMAEKKSQMSSNEQTATRTIGELTRKAVSEIQRGSLTDQAVSTIQESVDGLTSYLSDYAYAAYPAMEKIKEAFDARIRDSGPLDNALLTAYDSVNQALSNYKGLYENGPAAQVTAEEATNVMDSYFSNQSHMADGSMTKNKQNAIAAAALDMVYRYPDGQAKILLPGDSAAGVGAGSSGSGTGSAGGGSGAGGGMAGSDQVQKGAVTISGTQGSSGSGELLSAVSMLTAQGNPMIFSSLYKFGTYYAPVSLVAQYTPYRLVTDGDGEVQILARGSSYYRFTHGMYQVERYKSMQILTVPVLKYGQLYADGAYLSREFGLYIVNLESAGLCILADESMISQINQLYSLMSV